MRSLIIKLQIELGVWLSELMFAVQYAIGTGPPNAVVQRRMRKPGTVGNVVEQLAGTRETCTQ
jgi:hypothetical protein